MGAQAPPPQASTDIIVLLMTTDNAVHINFFMPISFSASKLLSNVALTVAAALDFHRSSHSTAIQPVNGIQIDAHQHLCWWGRGYRFVGVVNFLHMHTFKLPPPLSKVLYLPLHCVLHKAKIIRVYNYLSVTCLQHLLLHIQTLAHNNYYVTHFL